MDNEVLTLVVGSVVTSILIGLFCGLLAVLVFTKSIIAGFSIILVALNIICYVAAIMCGPLGWHIGPIEVVSVIVFLGYCVTYCIHIAHLFVEACEETDEPLQQVRLALLRLGPATVSSAMTTLSSCIFLTMCVTTIFVKFGIVLLLTTVLGLLAALSVLPAFLLATYGMRASVTCCKNMRGRDQQGDAE